MRAMVMFSQPAVHLGQGAKARHMRFFHESVPVPVEMAVGKWP